MSQAPRIGIDLLEIERLERALERRPRLALRLFTAAERRYASRQARPGQHLAARFAAKEAATKALGLAIFRPLEIELVGDGGAPQIQLYGAAAARAEQLSLALGCSLTHSRGIAAAVVLGG